MRPYFGVADNDWFALRVGKQSVAEIILSPDPALQPSGQQPPHWESHLNATRSSMAWCHEKGIG